MKVHERQLAMLALASVVVIFAVIVGYGYASSVFIPLGSRGDILATSPLLPVDWETYYGEGWSVGHPSEYEVRIDRSQHTVHIVPQIAEGGVTYFMVQKREESIGELNVLHESQAYPLPVDVTIANYPAEKFTFGNGRVEYFIMHHLGVFLLATDVPHSSTISTMFATFLFTE